MDNTILLMQGDCLERMRELPECSVDMVLTDPPYGTTKNKWDRVIPMREMWDCLRRIVKPDGAVLLFSQLPFGADLIASNRRYFRYEWIWHKALACGFLNANRMPLRAHENILVFYRRRAMYNPQKVPGAKYAKRAGGHESSIYGHVGALKKSDGSERYPRDVLTVSNGIAPRERLHPTQKPVELLEYLIRTYTREGETVLDFCMGSGSTGVA